jgi:hypothetical protein
MTVLWQRASDSAAGTHPTRNRVVDFLRAVSIVVVVVGHWLMAAPEIRPDGELLAGHVLADVPWTQWLTWAFQVMPIFFMVGGYSNSASWRAAQRRAEGYGPWIHARLRRLVLPVLPLLVFWTILAPMLLTGGLDPDLLVIGSQTALVPVWFLAVYIAVVALTPLTLSLWERLGFWSLALGAGLAIAVDAVSLGIDESWIGWLNYLFIWGTVHQIGYAWRDERLTWRWRGLMAVGGLGALVLLAETLGYPVSMVGVPGADVNNTLPPRLPLLALGVFQGGVLLTLEAPLTRWLHRRRPWTATVLVNSMIMTIYLWHLTAMVLLLAVLLLFDGFGLHVSAGSGQWWITRPVWLIVAAAVTIPIVLLMARFERPRREIRSPSPVEGVGAVVLIVIGLALLAYYGIGGADGLNWPALALVAFAAVVGRVVPLRSGSSGG